MEPSSELFLAPINIRGIGCKLALSNSLIPLKIWIQGLKAITFCTLVLSVKLSKLDQFPTFFSACLLTP
jgi:hypothetical protein